MPGPLATAELMAGCFAPLADRPVETCAILYLDETPRIVGTRHIVGTLDRVDVSVRTVAVDALTFGAKAAVIAHNHPSGNPEPSESDLRFTRLLARGLEALGVALRDHVVVTLGAATSLRARGLL